MEDENQSRSMPDFMIPLGAIVLIAIVVLILRSKRKSADERAFTRIIATIDASELPERAKDMLRQRVDEVRGTVSAVREMAGGVIDAARD